MRKNGIEDWFYTSPGVVDGDLLVQGHELGMLENTAFSFLDGLDWTTTPCEPISFLRPTSRETGVYNLHGMLVYRGETWTQSNPLPASV